MPDDELTTYLDHETRIDVAARLSAVLDGDRDDAALAPFLTLANEIRRSLQRPMLSAADRDRIYNRALSLVDRHNSGRLRRAWPQLAHYGTHPAVLGGAAAAVVAAAVGFAALQRGRGQGLRPVFDAA